MFFTKIPAYFLLLFVMAHSVMAAEWPELKLTEISESELPMPTIVVVPKDPVYKSRKIYRAYLLNDLLTKLISKQQTLPDDLLLVFTAADGYQSFMSYRDALAESGYIAFKDQKLRGDKLWESFTFGAETITPAPFYLVWPQPGLDKWRFPWPFQLVAIALQPSSEYFAKAAPKTSNATIQQGFNQFSRYCIRCHAVNGTGGKIGPELIISSTVQADGNERLVNFILNAPAFNKKTKMPAFKKQLSRENAVSIIDYLKYMNVE